MTTAITELDPRVLWTNFLKLCEIPRPSKKEEKITEFMKQFGNDLNLETNVDKTGNVVIRKPAFKGYENLKCVTLQGHLDMVPQKTPASNHNFETDAIKPFIDREWITADQTTLGADNGIGVAAAMSLLESTDIPHGPLEALFTIDEESGMTGAFALTDTQLNGDVLLNLDGGGLETLCIGCAGGINTDAIFEFNPMKTPDSHIALNISVSGLKGGHSGVEIHLYRGNANKILMGLLNDCLSHFKFNLAYIQGGNLSNVIPREANCLITVEKNQQSLLIERIKKAEIELQGEFSLTDPGLNIEIEVSELPQTVIEHSVMNRFIKSVHACPSGLISMYPLMPSVVATSTNLSIIKTDEKVIKVVTSQRSAIEPAKKQLSSMINNIFELGGAKVDFNSEYPGWSPIDNSEIIQVGKEVYQDFFQKSVETKIVHGGLECGLIKKLYPNMDMLSIGPDIFDAHSPNERVSIQSVKLFWEYLKKILINFPKK